MIKIALTGKLRSGKDAIAEHLYYRHGFEREAFGGMLKYLAKKVYAHTPRNDDGKPRAMYQAFGQACREFDPDVWIRHVEFSVKMLANQRDTVGVVITDLRQPNEYEWCRANGFVIVRVSAPDELRLARAKAAGDNFTEADLTHDTEQHVDGFAVDYEIVNDGSIAELETKVDDILAQMGAIN